ncbi:MAG: hypothetical protein JOZ33_08440 [Acidobacteriaceae bacterium]|nr:hypothetical protein [Acidobacteriaceae bacterium]
MQQTRDAVAHIGPTLESEENGAYLPTTNQPTPESQIVKDNPSGNDNPSAGIDLLADTDTSTVQPDAPRPEPLKTRLPGDTSSDPHTDVGPDNATAAHARSEANE